MHFQANLLAETLGVLADFVQRFADLFDRLLALHVGMEVVRPDFHAGAADVVAQLNERFGRLDGLLQVGGIGVVELLGAADADASDASVGKVLADFLPLIVVERRFDAVLVRRPQFDAQHAGLLAIGQQRRQVPVLAPLVGDQAVLDAGAFFVPGESGVQSTEQESRTGDGPGSGEKITAIERHGKSSHWERSQKASRQA